MTKNRVIAYFSLILMILVYVYTGLVAAIPSDITIISGQEYSYDLNKWSSIGIKDSTILKTLEDRLFASNVGKEKININLFGKIPLKSVDVNVVSDSVVIPGGSTIGVRINTEGLTVLNCEEFTDENSKKVRPYESAGIRKGDIIKKINGQEIYGVDDFIKKVQDSGDKEIKLEILRGDEEVLVTIKPEIDEFDGTYKLGIWVREITSGVGTVTFIDPVSKKFGALGHGISDMGGTSLLGVREGNAYPAIIMSVVKGRKGAPGELKGAIREDEVFGNITKNTSTGIYGTITDIELEEERKIQVGLSQDVEIGKATILSNISGDDVKEYDIYIEKVNRHATESKSMLIQVIDEELITKTGGIVQGMSGSPILQNGKIIGAVTHVLVNDPTRGYGIFIENMLEEAG